MKIELIGAEKINSNVVDVTYKLDDEEFTVRWFRDSCNGKFNIDFCHESDNEDLENSVDNAIKLGELYVFIRDTFSANDCNELASKSL